MSSRRGKIPRLSNDQSLYPSLSEGADFIHFIGSFDGLTTVENYNSTQAPLSETDQYPPPYISPSEWSNFPNINDLPSPEIQPIDSFTTTVENYSTQDPNIQTILSETEYQLPYISPSEWSNNNNFPNIYDPPLPEIQPLSETEYHYQTQYISPSEWSNNNNNNNFPYMCDLPSPSHENHQPLQVQAA
ncbi:hypothetical protein OROHE_026404 [Orobanche hederae]